MHNHSIPYSVLMATHDVCFVEKKLIVFDTLPIYGFVGHGFCYHVISCNTWRNKEAITKTRLCKYIENFTAKTRKCSGKKLWYFSYFCSKHRLWVLVRTASARRFKEYPQSMFLNGNKKDNVYPVNPSLLYNSGVYWDQNNIGMFLWCVRLQAP